MDDGDRIVGQLADDDFAATLNAAIRARGLSLQRLRHRLADHGVTVSAATLSYWQNGRSRPTRAHSQNILGALEAVLEMQPGALTQTAPAAATRRRSGNGPSADAPMPTTVEEVLAQTGLEPRNLRKVSSHITVSIAPDRSQSSEVVRSVVQCLRSGTSAFPVVVEHGDDVQQELHGLSNCQAGEVWDLPDQGLRVTEMRLARPLREGEYMMLEYLTTLGQAADAATEFMIATPKLADLVVEVQFAHGDLPTRVVGYTRSLDSDPGPESADAVALPLAQGLAQLIRVDVAPAIHVVRWSWEDGAGHATARRDPLARRLG